MARLVECALKASRKAPPDSTKIRASAQGPPSPRKYDIEKLLADGIEIGDAN